MELEYIKEKIGSIRIKSDKVIWILVMLFAMVSVLAIYSNSTWIANEKGVDKIVYFYKQLKFVGVGLVFMLICYFIPLKLYRIFAITIWVAALGLVAATELFGVVKNGAERTLSIGGVEFQALEFVKLGLIFYIAKALENLQDKQLTFKKFFCKLLLPIAITCGLVVSKSASSVIFFGGFSLVLLFLMGIDWKYLLATIGIALAAIGLMYGVYLLHFKDLDKKEKEKTKVEKLFTRFKSAEHRVASFIDEWKGVGVNPAEMTKQEYEKKLDDERQSLNAKIAIYKGGLIGQGLGKGTAKYALSMSFSDMIFASIVEDVGLAGSLFLIFLYCMLLFRGTRIAQKCNTPFSQTMALGITWLIAIQALLHIYVNVRLFPITGHTLPFISQGGTAYIMFSSAVGILLSVSKQVNKQDDELKAKVVEDNKIEDEEEFESDN